MIKAWLNRLNNLRITPTLQTAVYYRKRPLFIAKTFDLYFMQLLTLLRIRIVL
jgi:hypothetical protein